MSPHGRVPSVRRACADPTVADGRACGRPVAQRMAGVCLPCAQHLAVQTLNGGRGVIMAPEMRLLADELTERVDVHAELNAYDDDPDLETVNAWLKGVA